MTHNVECLEKLINSFSKLSGVGYKTAEKYAYNIINLNEEDVKLFAENLVNTKKLVKFCSICGNFTQDDICNICKTRKSNTICVVKEPKDVIAIEKSKTYKGGGRGRNRAYGWFVKSCAYRWRLRVDLKYKSTTY